MKHLLTATFVVVALTAGLSSTGQQTTTPAAAPPATGAISGVVKSATTGKPIPAAIVMLQTYSARVKRQLTDAAGRFVFTELPDASYTLSASCLGYVDGSYGQAILSGATGTVILKSGQWFDKADIQLWKPGAISGRVVDERGDPLVGAYVRALAQQYVAGGRRLLASAVTTTDDRGEYRIAKLLPGRYLVLVPSVQATVPADMAPASLGLGNSADSIERALLFGGAPATRTDAALDLDPANRLIIGNYATAPPPVNGRAQAYPVTFFPGGTSPAAASTVELGLAEEKHGIDIVVQPLPAVRVSGAVSGAADQAGGLLLRLMPAGLEDLSTGSEAATTITGADGRFTFLNVPAGSYTLDARRGSTELTFSTESGGRLPATPGASERSTRTGEISSGPAGAGFISRDDGVGAATFARLPVVVSATEINNLAVPLQHTVSITGKLVFEGTTSTQMVWTGGASGAPRPTTQLVQSQGIRPPIYAEPANGDAWLGLPRTVMADVSAGDAFTILGLRSGQFVLRLGSSTDRYTIKSVTVGGVDFTHKPIDTTPLRPITDAVITFTDKVTTLSGFVQGMDTTMTEAAVIAFPVERDQWSGYGFTPMRLKAVPMVASAGYTIAGLPAGEYFVVAVEPSQINGWQDPAFLQRASSVAARVKLGWGDKTSLELRLARIR